MYVCVQRTLVHVTFCALNDAKVEVGGHVATQTYQKYAQVCLSMFSTPTPDQLRTHVYSHTYPFDSVCNTVTDTRISTRK